jgi:hypothetical protein
MLLCDRMCRRALQEDGEYCSKNTHSDIECQAVLVSGCKLSIYPYSLPSFPLSTLISIILARRKLFQFFSQKQEKVRWKW